MTLSQLKPGQKFKHPTTGERYTLIRLTYGSAVIQAKGGKELPVSLNTEVQR